MAEVRYASTSAITTLTRRVLKGLAIGVVAVGFGGVINSTGAATQSGSFPSLVPLHSVELIQSQVAAAQRGGAVPSSIISQLSGESSQTFSADACKESPGTQVRAAGCIFGDSKASRTIVLYGDSYALQWIPALDQLGKTDKFKVIAFARYGCPFAKIKITDWKGSVDPGCLSFRSKVIHQILALRPLPSLVLLTEETEHNGASGTPYSISKLQWTNAVRTTVIALTSAHLTVQVLLGTPTARTTPASCLASNSSHYQSCATQASDAAKYAWNSEVTLALKDSRAAVVNLSVLFCRSVCPDIINRHLVFSDAYHVNQSYSAQLAMPLGVLMGCGFNQLPPSQSVANPIATTLLPNFSSAINKAACRRTQSSPFGL